mmetsp:Transcript_21873/g.37708  ORF Transcript_21873/g.37708 Transcript_21873/m.37708 type:complete len:257 (+) Transcript_21873:1283-2053(+)
MRRHTIFLRQWPPKHLHHIYPGGSSRLLARRVTGSHSIFRNHASDSQLPKASFLRAFQSPVIPHALMHTDIRKRDDEADQAKDPSEESSQASLVRKGRQQVYLGPIPGAVQITKILSLGSCCLTSFSAPLIAVAEPTLRGYGMAGLILLFGLGTTGALHFVTKTYIRSATFDYDKNDSDPELEIERISFFGRRKTIRVHASQIVVPPLISRPMTTMYINEQPFFMQFDMFEDKELLYRLIPSLRLKDHATSESGEE